MAKPAGIAGIGAGPAGLQAASQILNEDYTANLLEEIDLLTGSSAYCIAQSPPYVTHTSPLSYLQKQFQETWYEEPKNDTTENLVIRCQFILTSGN